MQVHLVFTCMCILMLAESEPFLNLTIGGYIPDSPDIFMERFRPLFEDYLNEAVGFELSPPVRFNLVPADHSNATSMENLIRAGQLDFMCEFQQTFPHVLNIIIHTFLTFQTDILDKWLALS